jgi:hypothetical protein
VLIKKDFQEQGCFVLLSKRSSDFPEELRMTNKSVADFLINMHGRGTVYGNRS